MLEDMCMKTSKIRVVIVDDQSSTRRALKALLAFTPEVQVVGEASNGLDAVDVAQQLQPDLILMDAYMPIMDGVEATRQIKIRQPEVRVIVFSMFSSVYTQAMDAGADRFLLKSDTQTPIQDVILSLFSTGDVEVH